MISILPLVALTVTAHLDTPKLLATDLDSLVGKKWEGKLTYLDYTSKKPTTILSNVSVERVKEKTDTWRIALSYPKEPGANSSEEVAILKGGTMLNDEKVVGRLVAKSGAIKVTSERAGNDDNKPATIHYVYLFEKGKFSIQKLVRFEGESKFIERNIYRWNSKP
jgi:hypothetical protein